MGSTIDTLLTAAAAAAIVVPDSELQPSSDSLDVAAAAPCAAPCAATCTIQLLVAGAGALAAGSKGAADGQAVAILLLPLAKLGFVRDIHKHVDALLLDAAQQRLQQQSTNSAEVSAVAMAVAQCKLQPQWFETLEHSFLLLLQQRLSQQQQQQQQQQLTGTFTGRP